jgi:hypothetical protein
MALAYPNKINWKNISDGVEYYRSKGFEYLEVPWVAPTEIMHITYDGPYRFKTPLGDPVGSGEQSFLHLDSKGELGNGRYMTVTPCFRDEEETAFNMRQFVKLELYIKGQMFLDENALPDVIDMCKKFFLKKLSSPTKVIDMGDGSFDIAIRGIELGSYGIRRHHNLHWLYATGVAEPRLSQAAYLDSMVSYFEDVGSKRSIDMETGKVIIEP